MMLTFSGLRRLPTFSALLLIALASAGGPSGAWAQTPAGGAAAMGAPMGQPLGQALGNSSAEPLQRSVDAARQPAGADGAAGLAPRPPRGPAPEGAGPASGEPQPMASLAAVGADYKIGPSDLLDFDIYGVPDMQRTVRVNASGVVSLPLIGPVVLAGLTTAQGETLVAAKYAQDFLQNPQVSLFIKEFTSQRITIEGAVARPGIYPVVGQLTLLRALALAGGGVQFAQLSEVMVFRSGSSLEADTQMFDLEKIRAGELADPVVNADDVIVVKRDPKRITLRDSLFSDFLTTINPFK